MKLLLDENISFRVLRSIESIFPGSIHVSANGSKPREDQEIFEYARLNGFTILTFDEDYYDIQLLRGHPPKIVWLRFGNSNNLGIVNKLIINQSRIISFLSDLELGILEIY